MNDDDRRRMATLLEPSVDRAVQKIVYSASARTVEGGHDLVAGCPCSWEVRIKPKATFLPERILTNSPAEGLFTVDLVIFGNQVVADGPWDAFWATQRRFMASTREGRSHEEAGREKDAFETVSDLGFKLSDKDGGLEVARRTVHHWEEVRVRGTYSGFMPKGTMLEGMAGHQFRFMVGLMGLVKV